MHSSRMCTACSSSHGEGVLVLIPLNFPFGCWSGPDPPQFPLGCVLDLMPLNFPLGCGPGSDSPQFPPWIWAWRGVSLAGVSPWQGVSMAGGLHGREVSLAGGLPGLGSPNWGLPRGSPWVVSLAGGSHWQGHFPGRGVSLAGGSPWQGGLPGRGCLPGRGVSQHALRQTHPVDRQTPVKT